MTRPRSALVLANRDDQDPGYVGDRLRELGYELETALREQPGAWPDPREHDLVLSLGSAWSVYWPEVAAAVHREQEVLERAAAAGMPVLGICFGSYTLAAALGGSVMPAPSVEVGWTSVCSADAELVPSGPWFQWHGDSWTPPPGARVLAHNDVCPQAFCCGSALGLQFHPEVTPSMVEQWAAADGETPARAGVDVAAVLDQTRAGIGEARARANALVDAFLERASTLREDAPAPRNAAAPHGARH